MKSLNEILSENLHQANNRGLVDNGDIRDIQERAKQEIKSLFMELLGEPEVRKQATNPDYSYGENMDIHTRNQLRAELRKKISEL